MLHDDVLLRHDDDMDVDAESSDNEPAKEAEEKDIVQDMVSSMVTLMANTSLPSTVGRGNASRMPAILVDNLCLRTDEFGEVHEDVSMERLTAGLKAWVAQEDDPEERIAIMNEAVEELEALESRDSAGKAPSRAAAVVELVDDDEADIPATALATSRGALTEWSHIKDMIGMVTDYADYHGYNAGRMQARRLLNALMVDRAGKGPVPRQATLHDMFRTQM
eukprot:jgi/Mesvir1/26866/Mv20609-RA.1